MYDQILTNFYYCRLDKMRASNLPEVLKEKNENTY